MIIQFLLVLTLSLLFIPQGFTKQSNTYPETITMKDSVMKLIPEGDFIMGSNKTDKKGLQNEFGSINPWYMDEHPKNKESIEAYYINLFEITNQQFRDFVKAAKYSPPEDWMKSGYIVSMKMNLLKKLSIVKIRKLAVDTFRIDVDTRKMNKEELIAVIDTHFKAIDVLPVHDVDWFGAEAYCEWIGARLPTEKQWEKAARGVNGNEFPWGDEFEAGLSNTGDEDWPMGVTKTGSYKMDKSEFGIYDMAGNVSEWVFDWYAAYPNSDYKSEKFGKKFKVVRGAGWGGNGHYALHMYQRGAYRYFQSPDVVLEDLGFRCATGVDTALSLH